MNERSICRNNLISNNLYQAEIDTKEIYVLCFQGLLEQQPRSLDCINTSRETLIIHGIKVLYLPLCSIYLSLPEAFALFLDVKKPFF